MSGAWPALLLEVITMSLKSVREMVSGLPRSLGDQVVGYAESVERALPEMFREARRKRTEKLANQVVFIAGLKKLHWLVASSYWTLHHSSNLLGSMDVDHIRIGRTAVSKGSEVYEELHRVTKELEVVLSNNDVILYLRQPWTDVIQALESNGRK